MIHNHGHNLNRVFSSSTRQDYNTLRIYYMVTKSLVLMLSFLLIILDARNIKYRINQQEEIIAEVNYIFKIKLVKNYSYSNG
jgi:cell division protein FtsX